MMDNKLDYDFPGMFVPNNDFFSHPNFPENCQYFYENSTLRMTSDSSDGVSVPSDCSSSDNINTINQDLNSLPEDIENSILSILAKPTKKRVRARKVYISPVPKLIKSAFHKQYPQMLINTLNSHRVDTMHNFFSKYCPINLRMTLSGGVSKPPSQHERTSSSSSIKSNRHMHCDSSTSSNISMSNDSDDCSNSSTNGPPVTGMTLKIQGVHAVAEYWSLIYELVPDQIVSSVATDIRIRRPVKQGLNSESVSGEENDESEEQTQGIEGCTIVLSFEAHETHLYDVPPPLYAFTMLTGKSNQHNLPHIRSHPPHSPFSSSSAWDQDVDTYHNRPRKRSRMDMDQSQPGAVILSVADRDTDSKFVGEENSQFSIPIPEMPPLIPVPYPYYSKITGTMELQIDENRMIESMAFLNLVVEIQ